MKKKKNSEEIIVEALDALSKSVRNLKNFVETYKKYIADAVSRNDNARIKYLIIQKHGADTLIDNLELLKSNILLGVHGSQAVSGLGKLPAALSSCEGLLAQTPDFSKLGKSIANIFKDIQKSESEIGKLNDILSPKPVISISSCLDGNGGDEVEKTDWYKAELAAAVEMANDKIAPIKVATPASESAVLGTGDLDFSGIIAEENKKK